MMEPVCPMTFPSGNPRSCSDINEEACCMWLVNMGDERFACKIAAGEPLHRLSYRIREWSFEEEQDADLH